ncbi:PQQ-dependent sugar dehydrogenase [Falsiroseomonas oryziterrae]|uniref:PQQ-dependent sugar dehydrogenase n=1 Tax=Falsiroseomonas oryziterrae TaxID=2911368 RepID=UPI0027E047FB|nr:PQQ-dependent sugar dehydrogenase [Roseomonas sp. NPKOSM-4]
MLRRGALAAALLLALAAPAAAQPGEVVRSERATFRLTTFATGLEHPWGAALLPDGRLLVTERPGRLRVVAADGSLSAPLAGVPDVVAEGQGGLLDVALAPDFATTREIFLCHAQLVARGALTRLTRARLAPDATRLEGTTAVVDAAPPQFRGRQHYGCRIAFDRAGFLYLSTGERNDPERAQRLDDLAGKVLRLTRDGRVPADNPFVGRSGARPEIWSYGHRHPQGLALNPWTGSLWSAEFGPRGGDEVNLVRRGANYGWPVVSHGVTYGGRPVGTGERSAPGLEEPLAAWEPGRNFSPSGIAFYDAGAFPGWRGSLFIAALNPPGLVRLTTDGDRVTGEERLLFDRGIRMRDVVVAADGALLVLTDAPRGRILRLAPE